MAHGHVLVEPKSSFTEKRRVPAEPKLSPIQKRLILRAFGHSKAYKYTLEKEEKGGRDEGSKKLLQGSRLIHLRSRIYHQD
ncbi:Minor capsid VP2 [Gossypium arboreum]|uniref:Minor capsid VP2 n=1 Tax=Gossypium arboreum TaxID=29729 RepID=A0A0B0N4V5_GOSAR|nr:Minor capsid VP2 [Gossypium arboreum]